MERSSHTGYECVKFLNMGLKKSIQSRAKLGASLPPPHNPHTPSHLRVHTATITVFLGSTTPHPRGLQQTPTSPFSDSLLVVLCLIFILSSMCVFIAATKITIA